MYSRFKALKTYGEEELQKLRDSKVAVIGLGATGSVIAEHLARHGVKLVLVDRDYLEENDIYSSNLYRKEDCDNALPKAKAAYNQLNDITEVEFYVEHFSDQNIDSLLEDVDLVMDGTDNLETRVLIDRFCGEKEIPWVYTGAIAEKAFSIFLQEKDFSDVFGKIESATVATCETDGILREYSSLAATRSALKAVEHLTGRDPEETLDAVHLNKTFEVEETNEEVELEGQERATTVCGEGKFQLNVEISEEAMTNLRELSNSYKENDYLIKTDIKGDSLTVFKSGRVIVEAEDEGHARQKVSELLGV